MHVLHHVRLIIMYMYMYIWYIWYAGRFPTCRSIPVRVCPNGIVSMRPLTMFAIIIQKVAPATLAVKHGGCSPLREAIQVYNNELE